MMRLVFLAVFSMAMIGTPAHAQNKIPHLDLTGLEVVETDWKQVSDGIERGRLSICRNLGRALNRIASGEAPNPFKLPPKSLRDEIAAADALLRMMDQLLVMSAKHCQPPEGKAR